MVLIFDFGCKFSELFFTDSRLNSNIQKNNDTL